MKIIYPKEWKKTKNKWGEYWKRENDSLSVSVYNYNYIDGYRQAIKDIKKLNK